MRWLALGDSYTCGEGVDAEDRWPVQLADRLRDDGIDLAPPRIIATTGWTTDELAAAIAAAQPLGTFDFAAGGSQWVRLGDNTGEALANKVQVAFDAVRVTRVDDGTEPTPPGDDGDGGGCNAGHTGGTGALVLMALVGVVGRRRRRAATT